MVGFEGHLHLGALGRYCWSAGVLWAGSVACCSEVVVLVGTEEEQAPR